MAALRASIRPSLETTRVTLCIRFGVQSYDKESEVCGKQGEEGFNLVPLSHSFFTHVAKTICIFV